jgi:hypothetical protein
MFLLTAPLMLQAYPGIAGPCATKPRQGESEPATRPVPSGDLDGGESTPPSAAPWAWGYFTVEAFPNAFPIGESPAGPRLGARGRSRGPEQVRGDRCSQAGLGPPRTGQSCPLSGKCTLGSRNRQKKESSLGFCLPPRRRPTDAVLPIRIPPQLGGNGDSRRGKKLVSCPGGPVGAPAGKSFGGLYPGRKMARAHSWAARCGRICRYQTPEPLSSGSGSSRPAPAFPVRVGGADRQAWAVIDPADLKPAADGSKVSKDPGCVWCRRAKCCA